MKIYLTFIIILLSAQVFSQAWVKKKGEYYAKLGVNSVNSSSIFGANSEYLDSLPIALNNGKLPHLQEYTFQIYGQYGISDKINGLVSLPFKSITNLDDKFTRNGIADIEAGVTYALKTNGWQLTPSLMVGIPVGYYKAFSYNITDVNDLLILGDGETNVMPRLYFGKGFNKPIYLTGFVGYNYRTGGADEIDALIEGGYTIKKLILILKLQIKESFYQGVPITYTGLYDTGQEYLSPHFSLYYKYTENLHISLNIGGAVYAKYAQHNATINIGVAYEK